MDIGGNSISESPEVGECGGPLWVLQGEQGRPGLDEGPDWVGVQITKGLGAVVRPGA